MKKILAFILTLAMTLTLFSVGFVASAAPEGTAITDVAGLRAMEANGKYYLANDITLNAADLVITTTEGEGDAAVTTTTANPIVLPSGVTLDGNGKAIFFALAAEAPAEGASKSGDWQSNLFAFAEGATAAITIKNLNFGSAEKPILLSANTADANDRIWGIFANDYAAVYETPEAVEGQEAPEPVLVTPATEAAWENVNFYVNREGNNLLNKSFGAIAAKLSGTHTFTKCSVNGVLNGKDVGGWLYELAAGANVTFTECVTTGTINATATAAFLRRDNAKSNVAFYNCTNEATVYAPNGAHVGAFIATNQGPTVMDGNVNNANVAGKSHVGGLIGTMNQTSDGSDIVYKNNVNNGYVYNVSGGYVGGHVGNVGKIAITMENCVNNGEVMSQNRFAGGLVGRIANENGTAANGSEFTFLNCANYGKIWAPQFNAGGGAINGDVGGILGTCVPPLVTRLVNCVNYGTIGNPESNGSRVSGGLVAITDHLSTTNAIEEGLYMLVFENCTNYGQIISIGLGAGGVLGYSQDPTLFVNCANYGSVYSESTGVGGFLGFCSWRAEKGSADGSFKAPGIKFTNCANFGDVTGKGVPTAGIFGQYNATNVVFENVRNYGDVSGKDTAGILAVLNASGPVTLTDCANYGAITGTQVTGGLVGWHKGNADGTLTIADSANYGDVVGAHGVAGLVGQVPAGTTTIDNCINTGDITPNAEGEVVGGFVGRVPANTSADVEIKNEAGEVTGTETVITATVLTIKNSANFGAVTGSAKAENSWGYYALSFGQFVGGYVINPDDEYIYAETPAITVENCFAYGSAALGEGAVVKADGWNAFEEKPSYSDSLMVNGAPKAAEMVNGGLFGDNLTEGITVTGTIEGAADAAKLNAAELPVTYMVDVTGAVVDATPALRGVQTSEAKDGKVNVRFAAVIQSYKVDNGAMSFTLTGDGTAAALTKTEVYTSLNAGDATITAADLYGNYIYTLEVAVAATGTQTLTVAPVFAAGTTTYTGTAYTVTVVDGVVTAIAQAAVEAPAA